MVKINIKHRIIGGILFAVYVVFLIYFMFFAESLGRDIVSDKYHYNLVPFKEISRFITYINLVGVWAAVANIIGNVVAFIPFGLFLPVVSNHKFEFWGMTMLSLDLSLFIELLQLISKVGSFDVDDLMLNTLGGAIGYVIFRVLYAYRKRKVTANGKS